MGRRRLPDADLGKPRNKIAGELGDSELLSVTTTMRWISAANDWRSEFVRLGKGWPRRKRVFGSGDEQFLGLVSWTLDLACRSINPLQQGRRWFIFRRRVPKALTPRLGLRCECGHAFGQHTWETKRRWLRVVHPTWSHHDIGGECRECTCKRFRYSDPNHIKATLRRMRLMGPHPYGDAAPEGMVIERDRPEAPG
jgi:hypothetical protein